MNRFGWVVVVALLTLGSYNTWQRAHDPRNNRAAYTITKLEPFQIEARVLSTCRYRWDREAVLAPVDLALGWGPMADPTVLSQLTISQDGRWYTFQWRGGGPPIPEDDIIAHSANMHMIPADDDVARTLKQIRRDQQIELRGYLVEAVGPDGWRWRSSLSRTDTGGHACELVLVESMTVR